MPRLLLFVVLLAPILQAFPFFTGGNLPAGYVGEPYSFHLQVSSSSASYQVSISGGDFPPGLSVSQTGLISGRPTSSGDFTFTLRVVDNTGQSQATMRISVHPPLPVQPPSTRPVHYYAIMFADFQEQLNLSGFPANASVRLISGALPPGIVCDSRGLIQGRTVVEGTYFAQLALSDAEGRTYVNFQVTIRVLIAGIIILSDKPLPARLGQAYEHRFRTGLGTGEPNPRFELLSGSLPPGLSMGASGVISGIPTQLGTFPSNWAAVDSAGMGTNYPTEFVVSRTGLGLLQTQQIAFLDEPFEYVVETVRGDPPFRFALVDNEMPTGLTLDPTTGRISGVVTERGDGVGAPLIRVTDSSGVSYEGRVIIWVSYPELSLPLADLPPAYQGVFYSARLPLSGGSAPYRVSVSQGPLPQGLSISNDAVISGVPTVSGEFLFLVEVRTEQQGAGAHFTVKVGKPPLSVRKPAFSVGYVGMEYAKQLEVSGGEGILEYIPVTALPPGLRLSTSGLLQGTPTLAGSFPVTVRIFDRLKQYADAEGTVVIEARPISFGILAPQITGLLKGAPWTLQLNAIAGSPPYRWSIPAGSLPSGLQLDSRTGVISGAPLATGPSTAIIQVNDANSLEARLALSLDVETPEILPKCVAGQAYHVMFPTVSATQYTLQLSASRRLPPGLTLDNSGILKGVPQYPGRYYVSVRATPDGHAATTRSFLLDIETRPKRPTVGNMLLPGTSVGVPYGIQLSGAAANSTWSLASGALPPGLGLDTSGRISGTATVAGHFEFAATASGILGRVFSLEVLPSGAPALFSAANSADYRSSALSPKSLISIFGSNLGPSSLVLGSADSQGRLPTEVAGTRVLINGQVAPLLYVSSNQIGAVVPALKQEAMSQQVVIERGGVQSVPLELSFIAEQPAIFTLNGSGSGAAAALNQDSSINAITKPARRSSVVSIFLTGCGDYIGQAVAGAIATEAVRLIGSVGASVGGRDAEVIYAGSAPGSPIGVCQLNLRIPSGAPSGAAEVAISIGLGRTQSKATIYVE